MFSNLRLRFGFGSASASTEGWGDTRLIGFGCGQKLTLGRTLLQSFSKLSKYFIICSLFFITYGYILFLSYWSYFKIFWSVLGLGRSKIFVSYAHSFINTSLVRSLIEAFFYAQFINLISTYMIHPPLRQEKIYAAYIRLLSLSYQWDTKSYLPLYVW